MARKEDRLRTITQLIASCSIATQSGLLAALKKKGLRVTQATLSRDLSELGVHKRQGRYALPPARQSRSVRIDYSAVIHEIVPCGPHMIVIKTASGQAQGVAAMIDQAGENAFLATLAGDDVILILTRNRRTQQVAFRRLRQWFGEKYE